jgi:HEPN domain-containing protein
MTLEDATRAWVARWIRLGEGDLSMARLGLASDGFDVYELVGFHAQQAVEKLIKAFLAKRAVDFEDQHDIDYLQRRVAKVDAGLAARIDQAAALNRYAVGTRYPGRYGPVTRAQAESAVQIAESVRAAILPCLQDSPPGESARDRLRQRRSMEKEE